MEKDGVKKERAAGNQYGKRGRGRLGQRDCGSGGGLEVETIGWEGGVEYANLKRFLADELKDERRGGGEVEYYERRE